MSVTALILHQQPHQFLYGALNSLLSQTVPIERIIALNSTGKAINKDIPKGSVEVVGVEPYNNYLSQINLILPTIKTEYLFVGDSKNLFYKNMIENLMGRLDKYPNTVGSYCDFDLYVIPTNQSVRAFIPSYDSRFLIQGMQFLPNILLRVDLLTQSYPIDNWIKVAQKAMFIHTPEPLYMERSFDQPQAAPSNK